MKEPKHDHSQPRHALDKPTRRAKHRGRPDRARTTADITDLTARVNAVTDLVNADSDLGIAVLKFVGVLVALAVFLVGTAGGVTGGAPTLPDATPNSRSTHMTKTPDQYLLALHATLQARNLTAVDPADVNTGLRLTAEQGDAHVQDLQEAGLVTTQPSRHAGGRMIWLIGLTPSGHARVRHLDDDQRGGPLQAAPGDDWVARDLPVLRLAASAEQRGHGLTPDDFTEHLGFRMRDVDHAMFRLRDFGYLTFRREAGGEYESIRVTEKGAREVGVWPTPEAAVDRLIATLEALAADETLPQEERSKARTFAKWLASTTQAVVLGIGTSLAAGQIPGQ